MGFSRILHWNYHYGVHYTAQYQEKWKYCNNRPLARPDTLIPHSLSSHSWSPLTCAAQRKIRLLVDANAASALSLLRQYSRSDAVFTVFTAHWTFNAALCLFRSQEERNTWYPMALTIIERCSLKWPEVGALQGSLCSTLSSNLPTKS